LKTDAVIAFDCRLFILILEIMINRVIVLRTLIGTRRRIPL